MMTFNPGELIFTTRGIAEIQGTYEEDGIQKVRLYLHIVQRQDGVSATGDVVLMSTPPVLLQEWIDDFPRDMAERRQVVSAKGLHEILNRIDKAQTDGPTVKAKRVEVKR